MNDPRLADIGRRHGIRLLLQFGSSVSGTFHPRSDVDLAVLLERASLSLRQRADLLHDLQALHPDREVDLVVINRADPLLLKKIVEKVPPPVWARAAAPRAKDVRVRAPSGSPQVLRARALVCRPAPRPGGGLMIDRELATRKLTLILGDLNELSAVASRPLDEYLASIRDELVAERLLERIIGRMIDINYHLLTETGQPPPRDYHDSFVQLGTARILPIDFARRVAACAGLPNRIVHEYEEIDPARVYEALQTAVTDIPEYLRYVYEYVEKLGPP